MTEKEICGLHYLNKEIATLYEELNLLRGKSIARGKIAVKTAKGERRDFIPEHMEKILGMEKVIERKLEELQDKRKEVERLIEGIEDPELRLIVRLKAINNMGWEDIGQQIGMARTTASRKFKKFCESEYLHTM